MLKTMKILLCHDFNKIIFAVDFDAFPFAACISYIGEIQLNLETEDSEDEADGQTSKTCYSYEPSSCEKYCAFEQSKNKVIKEQDSLVDMGLNHNYPLFSPSLTEKPRNYISLNPARLQEVPFRNCKVGRPKNVSVGEETFPFLTNPLYYCDSSTNQKNDSLEHYQNLTVTSANHISTSIEKSTIVNRKEDHQNLSECINHHSRLTTSSEISKVVKQECLESSHSKNHTLTKRKVGRPKKSVTDAPRSLVLFNENCHSINPVSQSSHGEHVNLNIFNQLSSNTSSCSRNLLQPESQLVNQENTVYSQSRVQTLIKRKVGRPKKLVRNTNKPSTLFNEYCHAMVTETQSTLIDNMCSNINSQSSLKTDSFKTRNKRQTESKPNERVNIDSSQLQVHTLIKQKVGRPKKKVKDTNNPSTMINEYCHATVSDTQTTLVENVCSHIVNKSSLKTDSCSKTINEMQIENQTYKKENTVSSELLVHTLTKRKVGRPKKVVEDPQQSTTMFIENCHAMVSETQSTLVDKVGDCVRNQSMLNTDSFSKTKNEIQNENQANKNENTISTHLTVHTLIKRKVGRPKKVFKGTKKTLTPLNGSCHLMKPEMLSTLIENVHVKTEPFSFQNKIGSLEVKSKAGRPPKGAKKVHDRSFDFNLCSVPSFENQEDKRIINKGEEDKTSDLDNVITKKRKVGRPKKRQFRERCLKSSPVTKNKKRTHVVSKSELDGLLSFQNTFKNGDHKNRFLRKAQVDHKSRSTDHSNLKNNKIKSSSKVQKPNTSKPTILKQSGKNNTFLELHSVATKYSTNINKSSSFDCSADGVVEITENHSLNYMSKTNQRVVQDLNSTIRCHTNYNKMSKLAGTSSYTTKKINQEILKDSSELTPTRLDKVVNITKPLEEEEDDIKLSDLILAKRTASNEKYHHSNNTSNNRTVNPEKHVIKVSILKSKIGL